MVLSPKKISSSSVLINTRDKEMKVECGDNYWEVYHDNMCLYRGSNRTSMYDIVNQILKQKPSTKVDWVLIDWQD